MTTPTDYTGWITPSGTYGIQVSTTDVSNSVWATPKTFDIWIKVAGDPVYANAAEANFTTTITMSIACSYNSVSCSPAVLSDFDYLIPADISTASTAMVNTIASTCSSSVSLSPSGSCVLIEELEIYDSVNNEWEKYTGSGASTTDWPFVDDSVFDATFGTRDVGINTNDRDSYNDVTTFNFRWKIYDALSTADGGTIYQTFDVNIMYACRKESLVLDTSAADSSNIQVVDG